MQTRDVFSNAGGLLRPFVKRRLKTDQVCLIINQRPQRESDAQALSSKRMLPEKWETGFSE
jgi:hypothetical protein